MTSKEVYESVLIELSKWGSPDLQIDEFNYFIMKGISEYVNTRYNQYDTNQQTTDDLQVLKGSKIYKDSTLIYAGNPSIALANYGNINLKEAKYTIKLPADYFHLLNCLVTYRVLKTYRYWNKDYNVQFPAKRMTADMFANIMNNMFLRPSFKRPYCVIKNDEITIPADWTTNTIVNPAIVKTSLQKNAGNTNVHNSLDNVNKDGKMAGPTMEINYGMDASVFELFQVEINYLKYPQLVRITEEEIDSTGDISQVLEFPEYVCREFIKHIVRHILLRDNNPKLQIYDQINLSVPPSTSQMQQVAPQQQAQQ